MTIDDLWSACNNLGSDSQIEVVTLHENDDWQCLYNGNYAQMPDNIRALTVAWFRVFNNQNYADGHMTVRVHV